MPILTTILSGRFIWRANLAGPDKFLRQRQHFRMSSALRHLLGGLFCLAVAPGLALAGITITGSTGTSVDFAAIFEAAPQGLVVLRTPDSAAITVPWTKIDLVKLKADNPQIADAYELAVAKQVAQPLGLGLAEKILSLSQVRAALVQALKDPYTWPWSYNSTTTFVDSNGRTSTRSSTSTVVSNYPRGYQSSNGPFVALRKLVEAVDDKSKKAALQRFNSQGYYYTWGIDAMLEDIDEASFYRRVELIMGSRQRRH